MDNNLFESLETLGQQMKSAAPQTAPPAEQKTETPKDNTIVNDTQLEQRQETPDSGKTDVSSPFVPFARLLKEKGVLAEDAFDEESFDGTVDGLVEAVEKTIKKFDKQSLDALSPEAKEFVEMVNAGVPVETAKKLVTSSLDFGKLEASEVLTNEALSEKVVQEYFSRIGLSEEDISEQIELLKDTDRLTSKAEGFLEKIKIDDAKRKGLEIEKAQRLKQEEEKNRVTTLETIKKQIFETDEIIPGVKLSDSLKKKIYNNLTTPKGYDDEGNPYSRIQELRSKDPFKFELVLNYLAEQGVFEGKWETILSGGKTKTVQDLEKSIASNFQVKGTNPVQREVHNQEAESILKGIPGSLSDIFKQ